MEYAIRWLSFRADQSTIYTNSFEGQPSATPYRPQRQTPRPIIAGMQTGNEDLLASLPESYFKVGTAEIKNWYPVIAAMNAAGLKYHHVDYVPCYRSVAGTGNAMGFAYWKQ